MAGMTKVVELIESQTHLSMPEPDRKAALEAALRVTMSPCEWVWTEDEQAGMAGFCLWACQRLAAIGQLSAGGDIKRGE